MNTLKAVTATETMANNILSDRAKETAYLASQIEKEGASIAAANAAMESATKAGNSQAYHKAKTERAAAADAKEMHEARLSALNNKPLISREAYEKAVSDVFEEIAAIDDLAKRRLAELSEQMEAEAVALAKAINKADEVLHRLQHDVYRDADRAHNLKTGEVLMLPTQEKKIKNWDTVNWGKAGVTQGQYISFTGKKPTPPKLWGKG